MKPLVIIRPEPGCAASLAAARALGLNAHGFPLFIVEPTPWTPPAPDAVDALLLGSVNALRHAGPALRAFTGKPAYVVGQATAQAAREAGIAIVEVGGPGLQSALDLARPEHRRLLRLAGRARTALSPPPHVVIDVREVYNSVAQPMPDALAALLARPAVGLAQSAAAARHFAAQCDARGVARGAIALAAIGPGVADAAGEGWAALASAESPDDTALLALAARMCQDP